VSPTLAKVVLAAILACASLPAKANLIVNGNFADPDVQGGYDNFANGQVPGWTNTFNADGIEIDESSIAVLGGPAYPGTTQSAELNGNTFDWISQTIPGLSVGAHYTLSWAYGDRPGYRAQLMQVYFGSQLVASDLSSGAHAALTWTLNSFDVVALNTSETLTFKAINIGGKAQGGNEITAVSLVLPEPASIALLGLGLIGFALCRRSVSENKPA
jgi:hypothetical protein